MRRHVRLGTEAVYRVCGWEGGSVEVEVVRAPGLHAGQRFRFDLAAVQGMAVVRPSDPEAAGGG